MGKDWTKEELEQASKTMMANGQMGYEEFCKQLTDRVFENKDSEKTDDETNKEVRS